MDPHTYTPTWQEDFPLGAHLMSPRRGYSHHGIYVGRGRVIHYAGFCKYWLSGPIEEVTLDQFCCGRTIAVMDNAFARHQGAACVERARQRVGEDRFSLWSNNCEHLCNWCVHGTSSSAQIEELRARLTGIFSVLGRLVDLTLSRRSAPNSRRGSTQ